VTSIFERDMILKEGEFLDRLTTSNKQLCEEFSAA
jgi:hypothetical protein